MRPNRSGWGRVAPFYDVLLHPLERLWIRHWRRRLWAEAPGTGAGLEVGAGTGGNLPYHPPEARLVLIDASWSMLRRARARAASAGRANVAFVLADARQLPFRDGSFQWAVATLVFCEVPEPVAGLAEMARAVAPRGPVLLVEHVRPRGLLGHLAAALTRLTGPLWGEHWDRDTAENVRRAGLLEVEARPLLGSAVLLLRARAPGGEEGTPDPSTRPVARRPGSAEA